MVFTISTRSSSLNVIPICLSAGLVACPQFCCPIFEYPTAKEAAYDNNKRNFRFITISKKTM